MVVTGAAGFIGSHLAEALLAEGRHVLGVDRRDPASSRTAAANLEFCLAAPGFTFIPGDLNQLSLEPLVEGADTVFHLAGVPGVQPPWGVEFCDYAMSNVVATQRLADACVRARVRRLVVASSSSVYGNVGRGMLSEDGPARPASSYGATKLAAERLCLAHAERPDAATGVVALRYFTVYGPRQRADMLIHRVLRAALDGTPIRVHGDGSQRRDFTYVEDVVAATVAAGRIPAGAEVVNVGGGYGSTSILDVVATVERLTGRSVRVEHGPACAGDVTETRADPARALAVLGWQPRTTLAQGIAAQLGWLTRQAPALTGARRVGFQTVSPRSSREMSTPRS